MSGCFHCGEPVPAGSRYALEIKGIVQPMCCPGCQAVAETILECGLASYYEHRTAPGTKGELVPAELAALTHYDLAEVQQDFVTDSATGSHKVREIQLTVEGLTCAACAWLIERHLGNLAGLYYINVNTTTHRARIKWDPDRLSLSDILKGFAKIGYRAYPFQTHQQEALYAKEVRSYMFRLALAGLGSMQVMMCAVALYMDLFISVEEEFMVYFKWISLLLSTPIMIYSAQPFYVGAWRSLRQGHLSMDVSVSLALIGAFVASMWATVFNTGEVYYDSITMFVFFLLLGRFLELRARRKASESSSNLARLVPIMATRLDEEGEHEVAAKTLQVGDRVRVLAGATLPADGIILLGQASLNESMLTGEQLPLLKQAGDAVYAGTINTDAPLEIRVSHRIEESRLAQIMRLQDHALDDKPAIAQMADVLSRHFILVLLFIAAGVWTFWHFHQPEQAFWVTLAVLVATCPCALSLATPTALTSATARLTRAGILLRRGHVLDVLTRANRIVMDKTGTLTTGNISLTSTEALGNLDAARCHAIARALEAYSEHPIARAFRSNAAEDAVLLAASKVTPVIGHGIEGVIEGRHYRLGSARWLGISDTHAAQADGLVIYLADEDRALARFLLTDTLRPDAKALIQAFKAAGLKTTILTGDSSAQADEVARELGVDELVKGVTPDGKLAYLKEHEARGDISIMVGDGINDAPVLAGAHASFAMAGGTDLAKNSADAILLADDLSRLLDARALALRTRKIIKENFAWSIGYNLLVLPLAASGWLPPYVAAAGMSLSSLIVVTNSMRLNR
ncbi:ATPase P [Aeromonas hydrophila]|uniref:Heavy metal translocating P-type ATPase n=1 Tax=Aeromonas hydrophila TaxID=644 RepID=A0AAX3PD40_AERHY|nr:MULTISPECIES: heavy metal translocating P-type ATPase [Aeromonas]GKQ62823.1 copper-translocating P-type ATPase [Aeromonas caviae]HDT5862201.1 cadmium-translocating P-type ATPase [Aeromonas hydrophila subsp. hydrophila]MCV9381621.1 heavy metal translocating P-type ATPase [Aeromonas hydrophila]MDD9224125.1 heavy metal translocating P-type ATPase [Aeromonas hydrophila]ONG08707.1 ATPase P [Aeromonas hydrophila]